MAESSPESGADGAPDPPDRPERKPRKPPQIRADEVVGKLLAGEDEPPPLAVVAGFAGDAPGGGVRLYLDLSLSRFVDLPREDVVHAQPLPRAVAPFGGILLWVYADSAALRPGRAAAEAGGSIAAPHEFLQGPIAAQAFPTWPREICGPGTPTPSGPSGAGHTHGDTLMSQAPFPTIPVVSCVTCTGVSPICAEQGGGHAQTLSAGTGAGGAAAIPTIPVVSCIACTGIPVVCAALEQSGGGGAQPHALSAGTGAGGAAPFPTIPVVSCVTCTGISPICAEQGGGHAQTLSAGTGAGGAAAIPTIPVVSCIACTGIPVVCAALEQSAGGGGHAHALSAGTGAAPFPTIPVVSCISCTGIVIICNALQQSAGGGGHAQSFAAAGGPGTAAFPTIPIVSCIKCTGIPPIC